MTQRRDRERERSLTRGGSKVGKVSSRSKRTVKCGGGREEIRAPGARSYWRQMCEVCALLSLLTSSSLLPWPLIILKREGRGNNIFLYGGKGIRRKKRKRSGIINCPRLMFSLQLHPSLFLRFPLSVGGVLVVMVMAVMVKCRSW